MASESPANDMASLVVRRPRRIGKDDFRRHKVLIDGEVRARLWRGQLVQLAMAPGQHTVQIKIDYTGSLPIEVDLQECETAVFEIRAYGPLLAHVVELTSRRSDRSPWLDLVRMDGDG